MTDSTIPPPGQHTGEAAGEAGMNALRLFRDAEPAPAAPLATHVVYIELNGARGTAITRTWEDRISPTCGGLCTPTDCRFHEGVCLVGEPSFVPRELCALFKRPGA